MDIVESSKIDAGSTVGMDEAKILHTCLYLSVTDYKSGTAAKEKSLATSIVFNFLSPPRPNCVNHSQYTRWVRPLSECNTSWDVLP